MDHWVVPAEVHRVHREGDRARVVRRRATSLVAEPPMSASMEETDVESLLHTSKSWPYEMARRTRLHWQRKLKIKIR